ARVDDMFDAVDLLPDSIGTLVIYIGSNELCDKSCNVDILISKLECLLRYAKEFKKQLRTVGFAFPAFRTCPENCSSSFAAFVWHFNRRVSYFKRKVIGSVLLRDLFFESGLTPRHL